MTTPTPADPKVTQADRRAAASFYRAHLSRPGEVPVADHMLAGKIDESPLIKAFARHRLHTLASASAVGWQGIATAPEVKGKYFFCRIAWGHPEDKCTGDGFRWNGRWFASGMFHNGNRFDECQNEFRQIEVQPSHWMPLPPEPKDPNHD